jgi:hypothetical protein
MAIGQRPTRTSRGRGGDLDTVLKKMFRVRGETPRIDEAEKLGQQDYQRLKLGGDFQEADSRRPVLP